MYQLGSKISCTCFVAFCWRSPEADGPKVGFTTPKVLGRATARNRMKRRVRETLRKRLYRFDPCWRFVLNLRKAALEAPQAQIESDIERIFTRCKA